MGFWNECRLLFHRTFCFSFFFLLSLLDNMIMTVRNEENVKDIRSKNYPSNCIENIEKVGEIERGREKEKKVRRLKNNKAKLIRKEVRYDVCLVTLFDGKIFNAKSILDTKNEKSFNNHENKQ